MADLTLEEKQRRIIKDPALLKYHYSLKHRLDVMFSTAEALESGEVQSKDNKLISALGATGGLLGVVPVLGTAGQVISAIAYLSDKADKQITKEKFTNFTALLPNQNKTSLDDTSQELRAKFTKDLATELTIAKEKEIKDAAQTRLTNPNIFEKFLKLLEKFLKLLDPKKEEVSNVKALALKDCALITDNILDGKLIGKKIDNEEQRKEIIEKLKSSAISPSTSISSAAAKPLESIQKENHQQH
jgi:hypothetical protein